MVKGGSAALTAGFAALLLAQPGFGAVSAPLQSGGIVLEHADTLRSRGGVRELLGNVRIRRGGTGIVAHRATHNPAAGVVTLTGEVVLTEPDRTINAARVVYYESSGDFEADGGVDMTVGDSLNVTCRLARYHAEEGRVDLYEDLVITNLTDGAVITGRHGWWDETTDEAVVEGKPVYRLPDIESDPPDTLVVSGARLRFNRVNRSALFTGGVELTRGVLRAEADSLFHHPDSNYTIMTGKPVICRNGDEISGRRIELYYAGRELDSMVVKGDAVALNRADGETSELVDRLAGDLLTVVTLSDSSYTVRVSDGAQGRYHVRDEAGLYRGVNLAAADEIELLVVNGVTETIDLTGQTSGAFYPPEYAPRGEMTAYRGPSREGVASQ